MTGDTNIIGHPVPRIDALAKVTGQALFPGDLAMPGIGKAHRRADKTLRRHSGRVTSVT